MNLAFYGLGYEFPALPGNASSHLPAMYDRGQMWSGLKLGDSKILLRIVSLSDRPQSLKVPTFPGKSVRLVAPTEGAYYLIERGLPPQKVQP